MRNRPVMRVLLLAASLVAGACSSTTTTAPPTLPVLGTPPPLRTLPVLGTSPPASLPPFGSAGPATTGSPPPTPPGPGTTQATPVQSRGTKSGGAGTPFHLATDLEGSLPTQVENRPLAIESVAGASFQDTNGSHTIGFRCRWYAGRGLRCRDQAPLVAALASLGKQPADVAVAVAYDENTGEEVEVQVTRVAGVSGAALRDAILAALRDAAIKRKTTLNTTTDTVGGKSVVTIHYKYTYPLGLSRYLYASGNVLYDVRRASDAEAPEILQGLP